MATRIEFSKHGDRRCFRRLSSRHAIPQNMRFRSKTKPSASTISTPMFAAASIRRRRCRAAWAPGGGIVSKVGHGVTHIKVGDRVVYAQSALGAYSTVHNVLADKAAVLPDAISFEQAAASFLKGLTVWYLLRKTYEIKPDEMFLFHAAAGGVGLIACQWAKALGRNLSVPSAARRKRSAPKRRAPGG